MARGLLIAAAFAAVLATLAPPAVAQQKPGYGSTGGQSPASTGGVGAEVRCTSSNAGWDSGPGVVILKRLNIAAQSSTAQVIGSSGRDYGDITGKYVDGIITLKTPYGVYQLGIWPDYLRGSYTADDGVSTRSDITWPCVGSPYTVLAGR